MLILVTLLLLLLSALILLLLRLFFPDFRYSWLIAVSGAFFAWVSVFFWQPQIPLVLTLPSWQPESLFPVPPVFLADSLSWVYAFALLSLGLATVLTAVARENFPSPVAWAGTLGLIGVGMLAVLANNPLALVLAWTAIDFVELGTLLLTLRGKILRERAVISFALHVLGSGFLIWAGIASASAGSSLNFIAAPKEAGLYMLIAAGMRLGVLPMHLPFSGDSTLRRGYGSVLRLVSAASSLILLARIPYNSLPPLLVIIGLILVSFTALYSAWLWARAKDFLEARPYWVLGMASLAFAAALRANPIGSVAWGVALIMGGAVLFLASLDQKWLDRATLLALFFLAALPFTLTARCWESNASIPWVTWILLLPAHALLLAGYHHHATRPRHNKFAQKGQNVQLIYPVGISVLLFSMFLLGLWGWLGARSFGAWIWSLFTIGLTIFIIWLRPRIRALNPLQAHWLEPSTKAGASWAYKSFWSGYHALRRLSELISRVLESDSGILWALLFLIFFASLMAGGIK